MDVEKQMEDQLIGQHRLVERVVASRTGEDGVVKYLTKVYGCRAAHRALSSGSVAAAAYLPSCGSHRARMRRPDGRNFHAETHHRAPVKGFRLVHPCSPAADCTSRPCVGSGLWSRCTAQFVASLRAVAGPAIRRGDVREGGGHREGGRRGAHRRVPGPSTMTQNPIPSF